MATIRQRGNSYQIRVSCGTDMQGNKIIESMTWKPDKNMTPNQIKKELNKVAVHFEESVKSGTVTKKNKKIKVHEMCDIYLDMQKKVLSPTSYYCYQLAISNYIKPALGHLKLIDVTPMHMQKFIYTLSEQRTCHNTIMKPATIKTYYIIVQSIFRFACKMGFLENNPTTVANLEFPKAPPAHTDILDEKGIAELLEHLENEPIMWKTLVHLALCTGCRRGELAALQWSDVDFEKNQIKISKTMYHVKGQKGIKLPKTNTSNRVIVIPHYMIQMLKQYKKTQTEKKLYSPSTWNIDDMIFTNTKGGYLSINYISEWFEIFLKRHSIPHIKFHSLRHTSATLLLANGTNIKTVSSRLGHSNLSITNRYVHALLEADIAAAETLEQKLNFNEVGQKWDKKA